jgi:hypothetical protein
MYQHTFIFYTKLNLCQKLFYPFLTAACAAANLAIGTLNGEQET